MTRSTSRSVAPASAAIAIAIAAAACAADDVAVSDAPMPLAELYVDADGAPLSDDTAPQTRVYKATEAGPSPLFDTSGNPLQWGRITAATGTATVTCEDAGTSIAIDARGLLPDGVYSAWLVFFERPGYAAAGMGAQMAVSPAGQPDGSTSAVVASPRGTASVDVLTPSAPAAISLAGPQHQVPGCLLDAYEVHVVLTYHQDAATCGASPCAAETVAESLGWAFGEGM